MSDKSNTGVPEDEKETNDLLALLYPGDDAQGVDSEVFSDSLLDDEIGGMQSLRSLFRDLPDEEPSDAVSNKLMALAAQHAPKPASESSGVFAWLSDLFQPVLGHPGFAAAATLVLVVGVAGTLYVKGEVQMAEPQVKSRAASPADMQLAPSASAPEHGYDYKSAEVPTATSAPEAEGAALADEDLEQAGDGAFATPVEVRAQGATQKPAANEFKKRSQRKSSTRNAGRGNALGGVLDSSYGGKRVVTGLVDTLDEEAPEPSTDEREAGADRDARRRAPKKLENPPRPRPAKSSKSAADDLASPPPPAAESNSSKKGRSSGSQSPGTQPSRETVAKDKKENARRSAALHAQAASAASRGDCTRVLALGRQIRKLDSSYYDRTFLSDKRLTACRNTVQSK